MVDYLNKLDALIGNLERALEEPQAEGDGYLIEPGDPPRSATYRIVTSSFTSSTERQSRPAEIHRLGNGEMVMHSRADVSRNMEVEVQVLTEKNRLGETLCSVKGKVVRTTRVTGTYEVLVRVDEQETLMIPAHQRLVEFASRGDGAGWQRWCAGLREGAMLKGVDLSNQPLNGFDLCCADLSESNLTGSDLTGADLAGADLTGCVLEHVSITGADLFRARLPRKYMGLLVASGIPEVESVIFA